MKKLLFYLFLMIVAPSYAQVAPKKIFFYADTMGSNKVINIGVESNILKYFTIYCPCMDKENNFARFMWVRRKGDSMPLAVKDKPQYPYISFKDLSERIAKHGVYFDRYYELNIVEPRKNNFFVTWKVELLPIEQIRN